MNNDQQMAEEIKALHQNALSIATRMLGTASDTQLQRLEHATRSGARIVMEFGPFPTPRCVSLVMIEAEGRREAICSQFWEIAEMH